MTEAPAAFRAMFAQGLEGYADDRLGDGAGWGTFDVASIRCPVTVLHGRSGRMVDVIHAHHTAELIPGANLVIFDDLGHFSIVTKGRVRDPRPPAALATQRGTRTVPGYVQPRHTLTGAPLRRRDGVSRPGHLLQNRTSAGLAGHAGGRTQITLSGRNTGCHVGYQIAAHNGGPGRAQGPCRP